MTPDQPSGQVVKVTFFGILPQGADPDWLNAAQALKDLFGFTDIAHLTVSRGRVSEGAEPVAPDENQARAQWDATQRAAEMERRYDELALAMRDLETRLNAENAENAELRAQVARLKAELKQGGQ